MNVVSSSPRQSPERELKESLNVVSELVACLDRSAGLSHYPRKNVESIEAMYILQNLVGNRSLSDTSENWLLNMEVQTTRLSASAKATRRLGLRLREDTSLSNELLDFLLCRIDPQLKKLPNESISNSASFMLCGFYLPGTDFARASFLQAQQIVASFLDNEVAKKLLTAGKSGREVFDEEVRLFVKYFIESVKKVYNLPELNLRFETDNDFHSRYDVDSNQLVIHQGNGLSLCGGNPYLDVIISLAKSTRLLWQNNLARKFKTISEKYPVSPEFLMTSPSPESEVLINPIAKFAKAMFAYNLIKDSQAGNSFICKMLIAISTMNFSAFDAKTMSRTILNVFGKALELKTSSIMRPDNIYSE